MARSVWIAYARIAELPRLGMLRLRLRLAPAERRRYAALSSARRRREFLAARWLLRASRSAWRVTGRLASSVSHSRGWVGCALARGARVGVDIEPMLERDFARLGEWAFGASTPWSREAFYRRWTRYEARFKAGSPRAAVDLTWFRDGVALSACLPWRAAVQAGAPRRWRSGRFLKRWGYGQRGSSCD